jgi:thiol-disulfide isomerase/thioredoxin
VRPNYAPDLYEQQRLQQYFNQRRTVNLNDGFSIANDSSHGTVVAVDGQSRGDYDKMIKQNFKYTQDNYGDAYKEAARSGKPLVAIFGSFEHNNTRQLVQNSLPEAQRGAAKDAVYIYVDRAKCKDGALANFADSQLAGGHNAAVSIVFTVKPGKDGSLQPEAANFRWQGADRSMIGSFNQAISQAHEKMESYKGQFKIASESTEKGDSPKQRIADTRQIIDEALKQAEGTKDWHQSERFYHIAINAADNIKPQDLQAEHLRINKELQTAKSGSAKYTELMQDAAALRVVADSKWTTRAELGLACLDWANDKSGEIKDKFRDVGSQWIRAAGERNPGIYSNSVFNDRLAQTGTPDAVLKSLLPEVTARNSNPDLFKYGGDGNREQKERTPDLNSGKREEAKKPELEKVVTDKEAKAKKLEQEKLLKENEEKTKNLERAKIIQEDEKKAVKTEQEFNAALLDAEDKGLFVVVKIGSTECIPCKKMAPYLKQAESDLKDKAVIVRVLVENTPELAQRLGADQGVPITIVAGVVSTGRGQTTLVPLKTQFGFKDTPNELKTFINEGLPVYSQWKNRTVAPKR